MAIFDRAVDTIRDRRRVAGDAAAKRSAAARTRGAENKKRKLGAEREQAAERGDDMNEFDRTAAKAEHKSAALRAARARKGEMRMRSIRTRIYPDEGQARTLLLWLDATRYTRNKVVETINRDHDHTLSALRRSRGLVKGASPTECMPERFEGVPRDVIDQAVCGCFKDCKSRAAQLEEKVRRSTWRRHFIAMRSRGADDIGARERAEIKAEIAREIGRQRGGWTFRFSRKKDARESMTLSNRFLNLKRSKGFYELFGGPDHRDIMRMEGGATLPKVFASDCRLLHDRRLGRFYLCVPEDRPDTQGPARREHGRIVSIDPGVRTLATCYDPSSGRVTEFGRSGKNAAEGLSARTTTTPNKARRRTWGLGEAITFLSRKATRIAKRAVADWRESKALPRGSRDRSALARRAGRKRSAAARIRERIRNLSSDIHWRLSRWLCDNADVVLLPDFRPSLKVKKGDKKPRRIGRKTVLRMLGQSHSAFKNRLLSKADERGLIVEIVREDYTSMTCGHCGNLHPSLGSSETFTCPSCGWTLGRDANGARNIMLRYLSESGIISNLRGLQ